MARASLQQALGTDRLGWLGPAGTVAYGLPLRRPALGRRLRAHDLWCHARASAGRARVLAHLGWHL